MAEHRDLSKIAKTELSLFEQLKKDMQRKYVVDRFTSVLKDSASKYMASVLSVVGQSPSLQRCKPSTIIGAAMACAITGLDVSPALGQAALVPYNLNRRDKTTGEWTQESVCQFQVMKRGYIQLGIRSGVYESMNAFTVYEDEIEGYNPFTSEVVFKPVIPLNGGYRAKGDRSKIVGYGAYFKLLSGYRHWEFWTKADVQRHAEKYSESWDASKGCFRKGSAWEKEFDKMGMKTVIKLALANYGYLTTNIESAIKYDQGVVDGVDGLDTVGYPDNPQGMHDIETPQQGDGSGLLPEIMPDTANEPENGASRAAGDDFGWGF